MQTRLGVFCDKLIEAGWLAAAVTTPAFFNPFSSRVFEPDKLTVLRCIVLVMAIAWLVKLIETTTSAENIFAGARQVFRTNPLTIPVLVFAGLYVLTTFTSISPSVSFWGSYQRLQGTLVNLSYITLFFLMAHHLRTRSQLDRLITTVLATSLFVSLYGIVQHLGCDPLPWGGDVAMRVTSTLGNAIFCAAYLILAVPLTVVRLIGALQVIREHVRKDRPAGHDKPPTGSMLRAGAYLLLLIIQLLAILYTKSRGPWVGIGIGLIAFYLLATIRWRKWSWAIAGGGMMLLLVAFTYLLNQPDSPLAPLRHTSPYLERLGSMMDTQSGTNRVRALIWAGDGIGTGAIGLINADPWRKVIGWGPETMYVAYNPYYPPDLAHLEARNATPDRSHNDYLDFLVTMGVLGLAAYLAIVVTFFYQGARFLWRTEDPYWQLMAIGLLAAVVAHLVETFFGIAIAATRTHFWLYLSATMYLVAGQTEKVPLVASPHDNSPRREKSAARPDTTARNPAGQFPAGKKKAPPRAGRRPAPGSARGASSIREPRRSWLADPYPRYATASTYLLASALLLLLLAVTPLGRSLSYETLPLLATFAFAWGVLGVAVFARADRKYAPLLLYLTVSGLLAALLLFTPAGIGLASVPGLFAVVGSIWLLLGVAAAAFFSGPKYVPILAYLAMSIVLLPTLLFTPMGQFMSGESPGRFVIAGFVWLLLGMIACTFCLGRTEAPRVSWRSARAWVYFPLVVVAGYVAIAVFLSVIIADIHFKRGQTLDAAGRFDASVPAYLDAIRWQGDQDFYYLFLGRSYLELAKIAPEGNVASTIRTVDDLFHTVDPQQNGESKTVSRKLTRNDDLQASLVALLRARELNPLNTDNSANLGRLYRFWAGMTADVQEKNELLDTAERYFQQAVDLSPHAAHLYDELGSVYQAQQNYDAAVEEYEKALQLDALYAPPYEHIGEVYIVQGQMDRSEEALKKAIEVDPKLVGAHSSLAYVYHQQGRLREAINENLKVIDLAPDDLVSHQNLAVIYDQVGEIDKAISELQTALKLAPTDQQPKLRSFLEELQQKKGK